VNCALCARNAAELANIGSSGRGPYGVSIAFVLDDNR